LLTFGLLSPWWHGERGRTYRRLPRGRVILRAWWWAAQAMLLLAIGSAIVVALLQAQGAAPVAVISAWATSLALYGVGGMIANWVRPPVVYGDSYLETVRPWDGWLYWLILLVIFAALYTYRLADIPLRIDALSARVGLAAHAWVSNGQPPSLAADPGELPLPTAALATLARVALRDNLLAMRVAG
jgi:hypothetical protein